MATILLVCTGNICRSPMALGFLRQHLEERGAAGITIESAGVHSWDDSPATPEAIRALQERGIDISSHLARRLTRSAIEESDLVLAMASEHRDAVQRMAPLAADRAFTLKELVHLVDESEDIRAAAGAARDPEGRLPEEVEGANRARSI